jgi:hypothetical protein
MTSAPLATSAVRGASSRNELPRNVAQGPSTTFKQGISGSKG